MSHTLSYHDSYFCEHTDEERTQNPKECVIGPRFVLLYLLYNGKMNEVTASGDLTAIAPRSTINILDMCVIAAAASSRCSLEVIKYIISRCPSLISDKTFRYVDSIPGYGDGRKLAEDIRTILHKYDIGDSDVDACGICLSSREKYKFCRNVCACTTPYHYDCIAKTIMTTKLGRCTVCRTHYKLAEPYYAYKGMGSPAMLVHPLFFPFSDVYPRPLFVGKMMYSEDFEDDTERLDFAIMYLQVERCRDLLKRFTTEQLHEYCSTFETRYVTYMNYVGGAVSIQANMPSNAPRACNELKYKAIEEMLNTKLAAAAAASPY